MMILCVISITLKLNEDEYINYFGTIDRYSDGMVLITILIYL